MNLRWVDDTGHTSIAVLALGAVEPDWLVVLHCDREGLVRLAGSRWDETREESTGEGSTWCSEGTLDNVMVLWVEVERYCVADRCLGGGWGEDKSCVVI